MYFRGWVFALAVVLLFPMPALAQCLRATHDLKVGAILVNEDLVVVDCNDSVLKNGVYYDSKLGVLKLDRNLQKDDLLPQVSSYTLPSVKPGQKLFLSIQVGHVFVQREVVALQPAWPGRRLFVRTLDGGVMSVFYSDASQ